MKLFSKTERREERMERWRESFSEQRSKYTGKMLEKERRRYELVEVTCY